MFAALNHMFHHLYEPPSIPLSITPANGPACRSPMGLLFLGGLVAAPAALHGGQVLDHVVALKPVAQFAVVVPRAHSADDCQLAAAVLARRYALRLLQQQRPIPLHPRPSQHYGFPVCSQLPSHLKQKDSTFQDANSQPSAVLWRRRNIAPALLQPIHCLYNEECLLTALQEVRQLAPSAGQIHESTNTRQVLQYKNGQ